MDEKVSINVSTAPVRKTRKRASRPNPPLQDGTQFNAMYETLPGLHGMGRIYDNKVYKVVDSIYQSSILTTSTVAETGAAWYYTLTLSPGYGDLEQVFDQYRVREIEIWTVPSGAGTDGPNVLYSSVIDYDDETALANVGKALQYPNAVCANFNQGSYRRFVPHIAVAAYSGSFSGYQNQVAPWIDVASDTVRHYGIKINSFATPGGAKTISIYARVHLEFRNLR